MIDFHNHVMPGVDDGAADLEQSVAALRELHHQGVHTVVATPHASGALSEDPKALAAYLAELDRGWNELQSVLPEVPGLTLLRGAEVMLDIPSPDLSDPRLRLAGTDFALVEFPFMQVPPNAPATLFDLRMRGWRPVLAHPERYVISFNGVAEMAEWRRTGALLQVNAGSLLGRYGDLPRRVAWGLVEGGLASYLGSDFHARGHCHLAAARHALESRGGREQAQLLTETNPARLLAGEEPLPVPPLKPRSVWNRLLRRGPR